MVSTIIISFFIIIIAVVILVLVATRSKSSSSGGRKKVKGRAGLMKEASRRLAQNPHDVEGLYIMGDIYYQDQDWEKAYMAYSALLDRMKPLEMNKQLDIAIRYGICALKTNRLPEAKKGFLLAETINPKNLDVSYNLGYIYYLEKEYEKAVKFFKRTLILEPNSFLATKYLGYTFKYLHKYAEALPALKKALDFKPDDKEVLFAMGECFYETEATDRCLKILNHLRVDPVFGPQASLYTGMIRAKADQLERAIEDFQIGLKHTGTPLDISNELKYRLAQAYIKTQEIGQALHLLKEIQSISPGYKDAATLIMRYQELNKNKNLQIYLMSGQSEFVALCRKIVARFYPKAKVKIVDISVLAAYTDIVAEIDTSRFSDTVIFRFFRSQGTVGELLLRELHARLKEVKGGTGICMSAGTFTEEAVRFSEGRPLDLYDKTRLSNVLNSLK
ncbi:tetratricopeptide repeat protein [Treponema denticola]|uniref:Tetratricopeptide repeat protein n=1 Tax=Treponema denticola TaxID=158 RepID=A0A9Q9EWC5_TREDN|nr:tetratricopeptide repeat protein [Treponema denticola]UTC91410.1 tetratricopeptide repeat protein [Treponema denticola]UTC99236.1 tetratricopeptide repeat protein [Treponema denticola]UTD04030.1 tetratricopeptide repeat protein [Treponema denticola]